MTPADLTARFLKPFRASAYTGPYSIRSHRTLAETDHPVRAANDVPVCADAFANDNADGPVCA